MHFFKRLTHRFAADGTTCSRHISSTSRSRVHRSRPSGGLLQHKLTRCASALPSRALCDPASHRGDRSSVAGAPSRTNFCRIRTICRSLSPTASAISQSQRRPSGCASSDIKRTLAHRTFATPADDCRTTASNPARAEADNSTLSFSGISGILAYEFNQKPQPPHRQTYTTCLTLIARRSTTSIPPAA